MIKKVEFTNDIWKTEENQQLICAIQNFSNKPSVDSEFFQEIMSTIWEEGTCYSMFFAVIPYLIEIAADLKINDSKDLWSYLGSWISTHEKYRSIASTQELEYFDSSLKYAEVNCIKQILSVDKIEDTDAQYLFARLFAFAKHRLGYLTMGGYQFDLEGTSVAECPKGHMNDVTVYNTCIVPYEKDEQPCNIHELKMIDIDLKEEKENSWILFDEKIKQMLVNENLSKEIKSHLQLSKIIIQKGVTSCLPMKYAFSLLGSLLYCNRSFAASMRIFHGLDVIKCNECGEKFIFADGWCEDKF